MSLVEDSDRNCSHCGKRMMVDIGQEDSVEKLIGWVVLVHECWSCGHVERDEAWKRPKLTLLQGGRSSAERLKALRMGVEVPMFIDPSPFPESELDEEESHAG